MPIRLATPTELRKLLREHGAEVRNLLGEPYAQLSIPTDGRGLRVLADIPRPGASGRITLTYRLDGQDLEVPVELSDDFETYLLG
jgi:hypothetical protein